MPSRYQSAEPADTLPPTAEARAAVRTSRGPSAEQLDDPTLAAVLARMRERSRREAARAIRRWATVESAGDVRARLAAPHRVIDATGGTRPEDAERSERLSARTAAVLGALPDGQGARVVPRGVGTEGVLLSLPASAAYSLRSGAPAVLTRLEDDRCLVDLAGIDPEDDGLVADAISRALLT